MSKKKYKIVVFDIDGVLNEHGGNIMDESIAAIDLLKKNGLGVCFASGKHAWYVQGGLVWSGLLDDQTLIVAENGGVVFDPKSRRTISEEKHIHDIKIVRSIFRNLRSYDGGFSSFAGITVWEEPKETMFCLFPKNPKDVKSLALVFEDIIKQNELKLAVVQNPDSIDVVQSGINKATGLKYICDWLDLSYENMIAFGDNYNDVEMLSNVGLPITLANGIEAVKAIVKKKDGYIASVECGKGVLEAVHYLLDSKIL